MEKGVELLGGGSVFNGAYPSSFDNAKEYFFYHVIKYFKKRYNLWLLL